MSYSYIIRELADAIAAGTSAEADKVEEIIRRELADKALLVWAAEDVREVAEGKGRTLTDDQVESVLYNLEHNHDATVGVTWDTIDSAIDFLD